MKFLYQSLEAKKNGSSDVDMKVQKFDQKLDGEQRCYRCGGGRHSPRSAD